jgi:hypothetical protein
MQNRLKNELASVSGYSRIRRLYQINKFGNIQIIYKTIVVDMKPSIKKGQTPIRLMAPDGSRKEERVHK